jgi:hypothetical protein
MNEQHQTIECVPTTPTYPDLHQIEHLNSNYSIDIFILCTLITAFNKLWRLIDKMRKQRKIDLKLLLQAVGAIGAILKAIHDLLNRDDENKDD